MVVFRFLADENVETPYLKALSQNIAGIEVVRVQDVGLSSTPDDVILAWATEHNYIVLTHDVRTMPNFVYQRLVEGKTSACVIAFKTTHPVPDVVADLKSMIEASSVDEWHNKVVQLPL